MNCPICFFRDNTQKQLKKKCFGITRFENKLIKYKEEYLCGIKNMISQNDCRCFAAYNNSQMISWTDALIEHLKSNVLEIESTFDEISSCYNDFIKYNEKIALDNLWDFLKNNRLLQAADHPVFCSNLLFRGRKKDTFCNNDIKGYFHIPFTRRHKIRNQRFSINGKPMIYLARSVPTVEKELCMNINNLAIAAFMPDYSYYKGKKIYDLKNDFNQLIENTLPAIAGSQTCSTQPSAITDLNLLKKYILMQILTFPVEVMDSFVPEYVLPQMLTTALMKNDYAGVTFPSTKDFSNIRDNHRYSSHHLNYGFFVNYSNTSDIDEKLLSSFNIYTLDGTESYNYSVETVLHEIESTIEMADSTRQANPNIFFPLLMSKNHLQYLQGSYLSDEKYFCTKSGKIELEFFMKMLNQINISLTHK